MIEVSNLVKAYGSLLALDGISFSAGEREIIGFLGPNGAGKSTCLNIMTGYLSSTSGKVTIDGEDISEKPELVKKNIGFLPEQPPLYGDMTVFEYLSFVYDLKGVKFNREKHLEEILKVTRLSDVKKRLIKHLSKGYKQRVGIAQALVGNPKVLIFDEPTVGLDPKQIIEVRNLIRTLGREHTVILSSHILSEVQSVADRIVIINEGKILADERTDSISRAVNESARYSVKICGPQKEVLAVLKEVNGVSYVEIAGEREKDSFTYRIESENGYDMRKNLFMAMAERAWPIISLETESASLEEVFIKLTDTGLAEKKQRRGGRR
ncbi:MAG: ATP-binding cassette domain-containing protein [Clostridia bacterium]|nr:ATP-binding cassette domain-containing protein [Clostridia bacterium]